MTEPMEKCQNCFKMFPESKIPTHFGYCRRNIKKCQSCGEMYDINFQEDHQEQFHKKTPCPHCNLNFLSSDLNKHVGTCSKKPQFCEYCQLQVPIKQFSAHLKICESRTKPCEKCKKAIANKEYFIHLSTCEGIIEQPKPPKNYNEHIENQRKKPQENMPKQYAQISYKPSRNEKSGPYSFEKKTEIKRQNIEIPKKYEEKPRINTPSNNRPINPKNQSKPSYVQPIKPQKVGEKKEKKNWEEEYIHDIEFDGQDNFESFPEQIPYQHFQNRKNLNKQIQKMNINENHEVIDEDEQLQKAILMSMGNKEIQKNNLPAEFENKDIMNESFYKDVDIEKQIALMEDIEKKKKSKH